MTFYFGDTFMFTALAPQHGDCDTRGLWYCLPQKVITILQDLKASRKVPFPRHCYLACLRVPLTRKGLS